MSVVEAMGSSLVSLGLLLTVLETVVVVVLLYLILFDPLISGWDITHPRLAHHNSN